MATAKKDTKGRSLKPNEDQLKDGRYRYRYTDRSGKRQAVSWKLVPADKTPLGNKEDKCLREIERDVNDGIDIYSSQSTVNKMIHKYLEIKVDLAITIRNNYQHVREKTLETVSLVP